MLTEESLCRWFAQQFLLLVGKDLKIEARSRQTIGLVVVLGLLIVVVLGLGLGGGAAVGFGATVVLWVAYLFSGVLCFEKTMAVERSESALAALMLAPISRGTLYLAKLTSNLALMVAVALVITPAGVLFFSFDLSAAPFTFAAVMTLGIVGFAAVGTLFAAVVSSTRLQGGLLAMMIFPGRPAHGNRLHATADPPVPRRFAGRRNGPGSPGCVRCDFSDRQLADV